MGGQAVAGGILLFISFIVMMLSYLIGTCQQFSLIAGLDESKVRDRDGLARLFRGWLLALGTAELLISLAVFYAPFGLVPLVLTFAVLHFGVVVTLVIRSQRYLA